MKVKRQKSQSEKFKIKLSKEQVKHIAKLACLELTENEIKKFQGQLSSILDYVSLLDRVVTEKVEPTVRARKLASVTREDDIDEGGCLSREEALANAPDRKDGFFKVKPVFARERPKGSLGGKVTKSYNDR